MSKVSYDYNSKLPFIAGKEDCKGNRKINGRFVNQKRRKEPKFSDILQWQLKPKPQAKEKKKDTFRLRTAQDPTVLTSKENVIIWLGHASFIIQMNGVKILTDPCLGRLPLVKRKAASPFSISLLKGIDYIMISHGHMDHFDIPSLKKLIDVNPEVKFLLPMGIGALLKSFSKSKFQEAAWYQQFQGIEKDLQITYLPAIHWCRRGLNDMNKTLWGSYYIQSGDQTVYFSGDTAYGTHFKEIKELMGPPNVALMPIGAYKPAVIMKASHVNPTESLQAFHDLEAKHFVPMHYGTFDLSDEPIGEPIRKMHGFVEDGSMKGELHDLALGEGYFY